MGDEEELPEVGSPALALLRQLKTCSWIFVSMLAAGLYLDLRVYNEYIYEGKVNAALFKYAPDYVPLLATSMTGFSAHFLGRRNTIIGMQLLLIGSLLPTAFTVDPYIRFTCAVLNDFGQKMTFIVSSLYVSEVSQAHLRAYFIGLFYMFFITGTIVDHYLPKVFHFAFLIGMTLHVAGLGLILLAPETPHYLAMTDRVDEADELLQLLWAGTGGQEASALLEKADLYSDQFREGIFWTVMSSRFAVPLFICYSYVFTDYQICQLFITNSLDVAKSYGYIKPYLDIFYTLVINQVRFSTVFVDTLRLIGFFFYLPLSFLFGRRTIFLVSLLSVLSFGLWHLLAPLGPKVLAMVYVCVAFESIGLHQIFDTLHSEIFPAVTRAPGMGLSRMFSFLVHSHKGYWRIYKPYRWQEYVSILYFVCFPIGAILVFLFMPETKDLPLTETENLARRLTIQPFLAADAAEDAADAEEATDEE